MKASGRWLNACPVVWLALLMASACQANGEFRAKPVPLYIDEAGLNQIDQLEFTGGLELDGPADFGGLSDLVVDDKNHLVAITDQGRWFEADLVIEPGGQLVDFANARLSPMLDEKGRPLRDKRHADAESLVALNDDYLVGFELRHRLWRYPRGSNLASSVPQAVPLPSPLRSAPSNGGMEAMTALQDQQILILTEQMTDFEGKRIGRLLAPDFTDLGPLYLTPERDFQPTGLATLPDGDVLLLERSYRPQTGVRLRLSRLSQAELTVGQVLERQELARLEGMMNIDNFEGIAIQPLEDGAVRLFLFSDDNFNPLQRTLLLSFKYQASRP